MHGTSPRILILEVLLVSGGLLLTGSGCSGLMHELQPHRLSRLNRGPGMSTDAYNFSVADPVPGGATVKPATEMPGPATAEGFDSAE